MKETKVIACATRSDAERWALVFKERGIDQIRVVGEVDVVETLSAPNPRWVVIASHEDFQIPDFGEQ